MYSALNATEFWTATDAIQVARSNAYGVVSGCDAAPSGADMDVTISTGVVLINGSHVTVAGGDVTLSSDPSNQRWNIVVANDDGSLSVIAGDPAPDGDTEPSKPSLLDSQVALWFYKVNAGQTIANNITVQIDKRVPTSPLSKIVRSTSNYTHTQSNTTLANVPELVFPIGADEVWTVEAELQCSANASGGLKVALAIPSGTVTGTVQIGAASAVVNARSSDLTTASGATSATQLIKIAATVENGSTAGDVQLQAAQNASHSSDSVIFAGSFIRATRIA